MQVYKNDDKMLSAWEDIFCVLVLEMEIMAYLNVQLTSYNEGVIITVLIYNTVSSAAGECYYYLITSFSADNLMSL